MTFTPTDTANYTTATATVTITVSKATPAITWPTPAAITYGTALSATQLNATAGGRAGHVRLHAGERHGARRRARPDAVGDLHADRHRRTTPRRRRPSTITVLEGDAGDHLADAGGDHLRHRAERDAAERDRAGGVAGTFVYTPASGTVLGAGAAQTLSVTFTPTDTANYTTATATVADHRGEGDAGDHLADAGGDHLRHGAECDAAERDEPQRGRHVRLHAGERHGAQRGRRRRRCR